MNTATDLEEHHMTSTETFTVVGMSCQHCIDAVTAEVGRIAGVEQVATRRSAHGMGTGRQAPDSAIAALCAY